MIVIGVDPGSKAPAHVALDSGRTDVSEVPFSFPYACAVFLEGQFAKRKSSRQSLMTLSFYAGMAAGAYLQQGHVVYVLQPQKWRSILLPNSARCAKLVFHNRARDAGLVPDMIWAQSTDVIDAYLIARAGVKLLQAPKRLPKPLGWIK